MSKSERIFLWLFAVALVALVVWELRSRKATPIDVTDSGDAGTAQSIAPIMPQGRSYLVYNQPSYNPGPPIYNVMPKMARAFAMNKSSCYSCGG